MIPKNVHQDVTLQIENSVELFIHADNGCDLGATKQTANGKYNSH